MYLNIIKTVAGIAASAGTSTVISNAIKATTPANINTLNKVGVVCGTVALSALASAAAESHMKSSFDNLVKKPMSTEDETDLTEL